MKLINWISEYLHIDFYWTYLTNRDLLKNIDEAVLREANIECENEQPWTLRRAIFKHTVKLLNNINSYMHQSVLEVCRECLTLNWVKIDGHDWMYECAECGYPENFNPDQTECQVEEKGSATYKHKQ